MTLSANCVWEIRPTNGADTNGGGFVAGATGTDFSQQNAAQYTFADLASSNGTNAAPVVTSAGHNFVAADVGNIIKITAGTNWIVGRYQIVSVAANAATLDHACGSAASLTVGTYFVGGAAKTIPSVMGDVATNGSAGNKFFVKAEATIVTTATITLNAPTQSPPTFNATPNRLIGYTTTRADAGKVTIQLSTNTGLTGLSCTTNGWIVENFIIDCNSLGTSTGISITHYCTARNCKVLNFTLVGITSPSGITQPSAQDCEVTAGTSAATAAMTFPNCINNIFRCDIHDNACVGILIGNNGSSVLFCRITNNTGASSDGIQIDNACIILNNTIYGNGRDGCRQISSGFLTQVIRNNILAKNAGWGFNLGNGNAGIPADPMHDGNAYWNNTLGTRLDADDTTVNPVNGVSPYVNTLDVVIGGTDPTNDPFTSKGTGDFTVNNTTGAGKLLRGTATPGAIPGVAQTGKLDFGCFQHPDPAGTSGPIIIGG